MIEIQVDSKLENNLSNNLRNVEDAIRENLIVYQNEDRSSREFAVSRPAFPTDYELAKLASMAYKDSNKQHGLPDGWEFLTAAWNRTINNGYYGCVYFNEEHQQIVIAHRGTNSVEALWNDLKGIYKNKSCAQMHSAATFTEMVLRMINRLNREDGAYLKLSFTGHSLGGWLAQVTTFTAKYLVKTLNDGVEQFSLISETKMGYHAHTVVFESPGCKTTLAKLKIKYVLKRYDDEGVNNKISKSGLDITTYLSAPNRINCCNPHVGRPYRIFIDSCNNDDGKNVSKWSAFKSWASYPVTVLMDYGRENIWHTINVHGIEKIVKCFDSETGQVVRDNDRKLKAQKVVQWPIIEGIFDAGSEYDDVFKWASQFNDYRKPVDLSKCVGTKVNYRTELIDERVFKLNVFSETEKNFVHLIEPMLESINPVRPSENYVVREAINVLSLNSMRFKTVPKRLIKLIGPNANARSLITYIKQSNHFFQNLYLNLITELFKTESLEYIQPFEMNSLQFEIGCFNLNQFIKKKNCQVLFQVEENRSAGALKIFKISQMLREEIGYNDSNSIFLHVKTILQSKQLSLASLIEQIADKYLFVIETDDTKPDKDCFAEIFEKVRENDQIKVILIVDRANKADWIEIVRNEANVVRNYEESHHEGITLSDLSSDTRKDILWRDRINFQGKRVSLSQIIPGLIGFRSTKDLIDLATGRPGNLDVDIGYLSDSKYDVFAVSNITKQAFEKIFPREQSVTLFEDWKPANEINRFVVLDENQAQNQFENICWHCSHMFRIHWLHLEENQLILKASRSYCDGQKDNFIEKLFTKKLKTQVREVISGCFVTEEDYNSISSGGKHLLKSIISPGVLMKLGNQEGEIKAGARLAKLGDVEDCYVERSLTATAECISPSTLSNNKSDIFAISNVTRYDFLSDTGISNTDTVLVKPYKQWSKLEKKFRSETQFIILDVKEAEYQFKHICEYYPDKNIHWLIRVECCHLGNSEPELMYKHERERVLPNNTNDLVFENCSVVYEESANNIALSTVDMRDHIVTVEGSPGMGKSIFFTKIALRQKELHPFLWVVKIKLKDIPWDSVNITRLTNEKVNEYLVQELKLDSEFEKSLFEYCLHDEKVVLILDAFHKVSPKYDERMFGLLEILQKEMKVKQLWLSTRPYALKDERLNKAIYTLKGFDEDDQLDFLLKFWKKCDGYRNHCRTFFEKHVDILPKDNNSNSWSSTIFGPQPQIEQNGQLVILPKNDYLDNLKLIAGIPLLLEIIANLYREHFLNFSEGLSE